LGVRRIRRSSSSGAAGSAARASAFRGASCTRHACTARPSSRDSCAGDQVLQTDQDDSWRRSGARRPHGRARPPTSDRPPRRHRGRRRRPEPTSVAGSARGSWRRCTAAALSLDPRGSRRPGWPEAAGLDVEELEHADVAGLTVVDRASQVDAVIGVLRGDGGRCAPLVRESLGAKTLGSAQQSLVRQRLRSSRIAAACLETSPGDAYSPKMTRLPSVSAAQASTCVGWLAPWFSAPTGFSRSEISQGVGARLERVRHSC
jgi:hypothetical protein